MGSIKNFMQTMFGGSPMSLPEPDGAAGSIKSCGYGVIRFTAAELDRAIQSPTGEFPRLFNSAIDPGNALASSVVYPCVYRLCAAVSQAPLRAYNTRTKRFEQHAIDMLVRQPSERSRTMKALLQRSMTYCALSGTAYLEKHIRRRQVRAIDVFHRFEVETDPWTHHVEGVTDRDTFRRVEDRDFIKLKWPVAHPDDPYGGLAPLESLAREHGVDRHVISFIHDLIINDGIPYQGLSLPPGVVLTAEQEANMKREFVERRRSKEELAILYGGAQFTRPGLTLSELDLGSVFAMPETRVSAAFGVPAILVGFLTGLNEGNYADVIQAREAFYEDTVMPIWSSWGEEFTSGFRSEGTIADEIELRFDYSGVPALQEFIRKQQNSLRQDYLAGIASREEARGELDYGDIKPGETFYGPAVAGGQLDIPDGAPPAYQEQYRPEPGPAPYMGSPSGPAMHPEHGWRSDVQPRRGSRVSPVEKPAENGYVSRNGNITNHSPLGY